VFGANTLFDSTRLDTFNLAALYPYTHSIHFPCSSIFDPRLWPHGPVPELPNAPESITDTEPVLQRQAIPDASSMARHAAGPRGTGRAPPLVSNTSRRARPLQDFDSDRLCVILSLGMIKEHNKQGPATTHLPRKPRPVPRISTIDSSEPIPQSRTLARRFRTSQMPPASANTRTLSAPSTHGSPIGSLGCLVLPAPAKRTPSPRLRGEIPSSQPTTQTTIGPAASSDGVSRTTPGLEEIGDLEVSVVWTQGLCLELGSSFGEASHLWRSSTKFPEKQRGAVEDRYTQSCHCCRHVP
jgi:hypothetical protein